MQSLVCSRSLPPWVCVCVCMLRGGGLRLWSVGAPPVECYGVTGFSVSQMEVGVASVLITTVWEIKKNPFFFMINNLKLVINPKGNQSRKRTITQTNQRPERDKLRRSEANWRKMSLEFHEQEMEYVWLVLIKFVGTVVFLCWSSLKRLIGNKPMPQF